MRHDLNDTSYYYDILERVAKNLRPSVYLEFGVLIGESLERVARHAEMAIGVDVNPPPQFRAANIDFHQMTTARFAEEVLPKLPPIEMVFIDADHKHPAPFEDFKRVWPYVAPNGLVFLHDTWPSAPERATAAWCNDAWRTPQAIREWLWPDNNDLITLPLDPGLTIVKKPGPEPWR